MKKLSKLTQVLIVITFGCALGFLFQGRISFAYGAVLGAAVVALSIALRKK